MLPSVVNLFEIKVYHAIIYTRYLFSLYPISSFISIVLFIERKLSRMKEKYQTGGSRNPPNST